MQKQAQSRAGMGAGDFLLGRRAELSLAGQAVSACTRCLTATHDAEGKGPCTRVPQCGKEGHGGCSGSSCSVLRSEAGARTLSCLYGRAPLGAELNI